MKFSSMSPVEIQFIRLYVTTLRRDYYLVRSVMDLMSPNGLGIKSFTDATKMALTLDEMHSDFETQLNRIRRKDHIRKINLPSGPTPEELTNLFSLSFFKVVSVVDTAKSNEKIPINDGWFSGKPTEWKKTVDLYKKTPEDFGYKMPDLLSNLFNTLIKFFPFDSAAKKWYEGPFNPTKKVWPVEDEDEQYFDDDDDDFGMSQFDMLYDPDEDE